MIDKKRVRQTFQRAAASYEDQAIIQHRVADHLLGLLDRFAESAEINRVLEIGCCTGLLTRKLAGQYRAIMELVLNDLVESFAVPAGNQPGIPAISNHTLHLRGGDNRTHALVESFSHSEVVGDVRDGVVHG